MPLPLAALAGWAIKAGGTYVAGKVIEWGIDKAKSVVNQSINNVGPVAPDLVRGAAIARGQGGAVLDSELRGRQLSFSNTVADWTRSLVASQQQIVQYNGVMRSAQMSLEAERIGRDMRKGALTQGSYSELARSQDRLERARLPLDIAKQNADNKIAAEANNAAAAALELQIEMSETLKEIRDQLKKEAADPFLNQIALQLARQAGPPRAAPPQRGKNGGAF